MSAYRPEQPQAKDILDAVFQSAHKIEDVPQENGTNKREIVVDYDALWCKLGMIDSNSHGLYVYEIKEFERSAFEAFNNMSPDRAKDWAHTVIDIATSHRRGIDAKSSESQSSVKDNAKSTLIDKINRSQVEKIYTAKGNVAKNWMSEILHRDQQNDEQGRN